MEVQAKRWTSDFRFVLSTNEQRRVDTAGIHLGPDTWSGLATFEALMHGIPDLRESSSKIDRLWRTKTTMVFESIHVPRPQLSGARRGVVASNFHYKVF